MGATLYPVDANPQSRFDTLREVVSRIEDLESVLYETGRTRRGELEKIAEGMESWRDVTKKEKMIYETLNLFRYDKGQRNLFAEGWCPTRDIVDIQMALRKAMVSFSLIIKFIITYDVIGGVGDECPTRPSYTKHNENTTNIQPNQ